MIRPFQSIIHCIHPFMQNLLFLFIFTGIMEVGKIRKREGSLKAIILSNPLKDEGYKTAAKAAEILMRVGVSVLVPQDSMPAMPHGVERAQDGSLFNSCDFIVTLGGDGTILSAARGAAGRAPILGINLGRKGFLTEAELPEMEAALMMAAAGEYTVETRMMLEAAVYNEKDMLEFKSTALNDIYVCATVYPHMVHVLTSLGERPMGVYSADGVLVSSPTGSTGYALSAGGPVVSPEMQCMLLTPVCAHTLGAVPLVIPSDATVILKPSPPTHEIRLSADGDDRGRIPEGWRVEVAKAEIKALFLRFGKRDFYGLLRDKLSEWNG
jgi:NAD+ kinase